MNSSPFITSRFDAQLEALQRGLEGLKASTQRRITKKVIRKGLQIINKGVKSEVPGEWKQIKKLIGYRLARRAVGNEIAGKVGVGVGGRRMEMHPADRAGQRGVGLSAQNVHWFILGTQPRQTRTGHFTGAMPPQVPGIVQRGLAKSYNQALSEMAKVAETEIAKECAKIRAQIRAAM